MKELKEAKIAKKGKKKAFAVKDWKNNINSYNFIFGSN